MSTYSKIGGLAVLALLAMSSTLIAASIPDELIGRWSASTDDFCGIEFTSKGYTGSAGEGYGCFVKSVRKLSKESDENPMWSMVFICEGEGFGKVQVNSLILLQMIKGVPFMAHVDTLSPNDAQKAAV